MKNRTPLAASRNRDVRGIVGYVLAGLVSLSCVYIALVMIPQRSMNILLVFLGGSFGWLVGIFASPDDPNQAARFKGYGTLLGSLVTGYVAGKIDTVVAAFGGAEPLKNFDGFSRLLLFVVMFLVGVGVTFIGRTYSEFWTSSKAEKLRSASRTRAGARYFQAKQRAPRVRLRRRIRGHISKEFGRGR